MISGGGIPTTRRPVFEVGNGKCWGWGSAMVIILTMLGFHPLWVEASYGDRYMTRAREIAAIDQAQIR